MLFFKICKFLILEDVFQTLYQIFKSISSEQEEFQEGSDESSAEEGEWSSEEEGEEEDVPVEVGTMLRQVLGILGEIYL